MNGAFKAVLKQRYDKMSPQERQEAYNKAMQEGNESLQEFFQDTYSFNPDDYYKQQSDDLMGKLGIDAEGVKDTYGQYEDQMLGDYNQAGGVLDTMKDNAMSTDLSPWAQASIDRQKLEQGTARDNLDSQFAGQRAGMFSQMASKGGLSSGARERIGSALASDRLNQIQGITRQGMQTRAGIGETDMGRKQTMLQNLPGMFTSLGGAKNQYYGGKIDRELGAKEKGASLWADMKTNPKMK